jgi:hypothetical protein
MSELGPERLCSGDEVFVLPRANPHAAWGAYCVKRTAEDRECPPGERLRRVLGPPREDCITDEVGHEHDGL